VLVGKSRRDNDELTLHVARPHDLFLHADKVGGSHVIVRVPEKGREVPRDVLTVAAQAAAYFSKAKHSGMVPVIYTEVRYVTKPRKAPPGLVRVTREQSLMVEPLAPPGYHDDERDT
jgi:predicted ribosome quality control (RQC) complex YloA/Tae2 family protein